MTPAADGVGGTGPGAGRAQARRGLTGGALLVVAAVVLSLLGLLVDPRRAAFSYLAAYATVLGIALGALSLLMIAHATGAAWLRPLLPLARATAGTLPLLAVLFLPVVAGMHALYPWAVPAALPEDVRRHVLDKAAYLNVPFFLLRAAAYFVVWIGLAELLVRGDDGSRRRWSAVGLPPFAFATTFAAIDWLMSLLPAWWSTIFGLYFWSGAFLAALAWVAVLGALSGAIGSPARAESGRSNTLGKLVLTFLLFWAYVGFSQFLVIWIGDVPLETSWLRPRLAGSWAFVSAIVLIGQFGLPFTLLLPRRNRARPAVLGAIAAWVLVMHFLDVYWLVLPALTPRRFAPHWLDLTNIVAVAGVAIAFGGWRLRRRAPELAEEVVEAVPWW